MEREKAVCRKREGLKRKENSRSMKKKQILEGVIERVDFPNKGYVYVDGEETLVIVKNGIPGTESSFSDQ